jgi:hypothetical protein
MAVIAGDMILGVYENSSGRYRWRLWSGFRLVAVSAESFRDRIDAELAAVYFKVNARAAAYDVVDTDGTSYWEARDADGRRLALSGRRFDSSFTATHAAGYISDHAAQAIFA